MNELKSKYLPDETQLLNPFPEKQKTVIDNKENIEATPRMYLNEPSR